MIVIACLMLALAVLSPAAALANAGGHPKQHIEGTLSATGSVVVDPALPTFLTITAPCPSRSDS